MQFKVVTLLTLLQLASSLQDELIINTTLGTVRGKLVNDGFFRRYRQFSGIPFAEPPVGDLRFRAPTPKTPWLGVRDAKTFGKGCPTGEFYGIGLDSAEDCLFLNVYTPVNGHNVSVLFWIYGGSYLIGDGSDLIYGPKYLLRENVIVVTLNYRLATLGFLSTDDAEAEGNQGLKDMVLALHWVKDNIASFGGNPEAVTLMGQSAGAGSVHLLTLSRLARGLFSRAVMMSGNAFAPFIVQDNPAAQATALGRRMGLSFNNTAQLMQQLRSVPLANILNAQKGFLTQSEPLGLRSFEFGAIVESSTDAQNAFLSRSPINIIQSRSYADVPLLVGDVSREGLLMIRPAQIIPHTLDRYNQHPDYFVPTSFNLPPGSPQSNVVAADFKATYFNNRALSHDTLGQFADFHTDAQFRFPTARLLKLLANATAPVYRYTFAFDGSLNLVKSLLLLGRYSGVCHADDLFYLFAPKLALPMWPTNPAIDVRARLARMFANFAKYGDPTPILDNLITTRWRPYTDATRNYLEIGHGLAAKTFVNGNLDKWLTYQLQFTGHY